MYKEAPRILHIISQENEDCVIISCVLPSECRGFHPAKQKILLDPLHTSKDLCWLYQEVDIKIRVLVLNFWK